MSSSRPLKGITVVALLVAGWPMNPNRAITFTLAMAAALLASVLPPTGTALASGAALPVTGSVADTWPADGRRVMRVIPYSLWLLEGGPNRVSVVGVTPLCATEIPIQRSGLSGGATSRDGQLLAGLGSEPILACVSVNYYSFYVQSWSDLITDGLGSAFAVYRVIGAHSASSATIEAIGPGGAVHVPAGDSYDGYQFSPSLASSRDGIVYGLWGTRTGNSSLLFVQAFRHSGAVSAQVLVDSLSTNDSYALCADGRGNAVVAWYNVVGPVIDSSRVQKYDHDGIAAWPQGGVFVRGQVRAMAPDSMGGVYVTTYNAPTRELRMHHLDANGGAHAGWPLAGLTLSTCSDFVPVLMADGTGGVFLVSRCLNGSHGLTRFLATGQIAPGWETEVVLLGDVHLCPDGQGGVYSVRSEAHGASTGVDLYARHVLSDGTFVGDPAGNLILSANGTQTIMDLLSDGGGGYYAGWIDDRDGTFQAYVTHLALDLQTAAEFSLVRVEAFAGVIEVAWSSADRTYAGTVYRRANDGPWQRLRSVGADGSGLVTVRDAAITSGSAYCYRLADAAGAMNVATEVCATAMGAAPVAGRLGPIPTRGHLEWTLAGTTSAPIDLEVFDLAGRGVMRERLAPGRVAAFDLPDDLRAGVYLVSIRQGGREVRARTVLVR